MKRRTFVHASLLGLTLPSLVSCGSSSEESPVAGPVSNTVSPQAVDSLLNPDGAFPFGVASGDPNASQIILWTALRPADSQIESIPVRLEYVLRAEPVPSPADWEALFEGPSVLSLGNFMALKNRDFTVKVDLGNESLYAGTEFAQGRIASLPENTFIYYRFLSGSQASRVGQAKTLPATRVEACRFATVSCSNLPAGYFSVYEMVRKEPLDFVVHLGDYLYEYGSGSYGDGESLTRLGVARVPNPPREMVVREDYILRHQQYKMDTDLQNLHATHPMICVWDDHEITNDAYRDGAENHNEGEGDYQERKATAIRTYFNWMPLREFLPREPQTMAPDPREVIYRSFRVGDLMDLLMLDTRIIGRDKQAEIPAVDPQRFDENRSLLGLDQRAWLSKRVFESRQNGSLWTVLGQQVMFGQLNLLELPGVKAFDQTLLGNLVALNMDQWDGYVAERNRVFNLIKNAGIENLVVLTGDIHTSWAIELYENPSALIGGTLQQSLGVELVCPSVTSAGFPDEIAGVVSAGIPLLNPHIRYNELVSKGFTLVDINRERMEVTWKYAASISDESLIGVEDESKQVTLTVPVGSNRFETAQALPLPVPLQLPALG